MSKPLVVVGIGQLAEQVRFYFETLGSRRIDAYAVDPEYLREPHFEGRPVLAFDDAVTRYPPATNDLFVAIGHVATEARRRKYLAARALGYEMPSYVHPTASVAANVIVGPNTLIQELAMVAPFVRLGDDVFLCPHVGINHHSRVGAHCFFAAGAVVCGDVTIGEACFIGANAMLRDRITVGGGNVIGAGTIVMGDCAPNGLYRADRTQRTRTLP